MKFGPRLYNMHKETKQNGSATWDHQKQNVAKSDASESDWSLMFIHFPGMWTFSRDILFPTPPVGRWDQNTSYR